MNRTDRASRDRAARARWLGLDAAGRWALTALLALATSACPSPATQLVVVVSSDIPSGQLAGLHVVVRPLDALTEPGQEARFALTGSDALTLPLSFGVLPPGGDPQRRVEVTVEALGSTGTVLVSRRARTGFLRGQSLQLSLFLASACRAVTCAPDLDCDRGSCVTPDIPTESLSPVRPTEELLDAGAADAATSSAFVCTPLATRAWFTHDGAASVTALTSRETDAGLEWIVAVATSPADPVPALHVHGLGADGSGERTIDVLSGWTAALGLWSLPSPDELLLVAFPAPPGTTDLRRSVAAESGAVTTGSLLADTTISGSHDAAWLDGVPVIAVERLGSLGLYRIPTVASPTQVTAIDPGTSALSDRISLESLRDGGVLIGRAGVGGCDVVRVPPTAGTLTLDAFVSLPGPGANYTAPRMAELADGRVAVTSSNSANDAMVWLLPADLSSVIAMQGLGQGNTPAVWGVADGSLVVAPRTAFGVSVQPLTTALVPAGAPTLIATDGADYSRTSVARHETATAIVYTVTGTPPGSTTTYLTVLCD